jgi:hypothetical protein
MGLVGAGDDAEMKIRGFPNRWSADRGCFGGSSL